MRLFFIFSLFFSPLFLVGQSSYSIKDVPNPKRMNDNWVSDPNQYLSAEAVQILNTKIDQIEQQTTAEVAIVVLPDISGGSPHDFALDLFNYWGVGKASADNGLLILLVMNQRRVEFITGYGMESILPDLRCYEIQQKYMVPKFKAGDYPAGLIAGLDASAKEIVGDSWENMPSSAELSSIRTVLDSLGEAPAFDEFLWGIDAVITDSTVQYIEAQAAAIYDSFNLKVFCVGFEAQIAMPAEKVVNAMELEWGLLQDTTVRDYLILYQDLSNGTLAVDYNAPTFTTLFDAETANYLKKVLLEKAAGKAPEVAFQLGLELIENNLKNSALTQEAHNYYEDIRQQKIDEEKAYFEALEKERRAARLSFWLSIIGYYLAAMGLLIVAFFIVLAIAETTVKDPYQKYHLLTFFVFTIWIFLFPLPYYFIREYAIKKREQYRKAPRNSKKNGMPMRMMTEAEEDRYLKSGQITEEKINSIHYDVWITEDESDILVLPYKTIFSKYRNCVKCGWKTYYMVYNRTISPATTSSSGLGEKKYACKHCNHVHRYTYVIPRKSESSSSSSGGSSSSFGGGSSGGGGAGSSW
jgi:uncharacterized protein